MTEKFREIHELKKIEKTSEFLKPFHASNHLSCNDDNNENTLLEDLYSFLRADLWEWKKIKEKLDLKPSTIRKASFPSYIYMYLYLYIYIHI